MSNSAYCELKLTMIQTMHMDINTVYFKYKIEQKKKKYIYIYIYIYNIIMNYFKSIKIKYKCEIGSLFVQGKNKISQNKFMNLNHCVSS